MTFKGKSITDIFVVQSERPSDNEYDVNLFAEKNEAYLQACSNIIGHIHSAYNARQPHSQHHDLYLALQEFITYGHYRDAIQHYNDWASELEFDEQVFFNVYTRALNGYLPAGASGEPLKLKIRFEDGADCKKCGQHNEYIEEPNQEDNTYLCGTCKALGGVFG